MKNTLKDPKLTLLPLITLVIGSMIGAGIFDLPKNMVLNSGALGIIISWITSGFGMICLALVFQRLSIKRPKVEGGIYGYAKAALGDYVGFNAAYGYWISAIIGNVAYMVILFSALGYFFPVFKNGQTLPAIIAASILLWVIYILVRKGVKGAAKLNSFITIIKVIPLIFFIVITLIFFNFHVFVTNLMPSNLNSLLVQVKSTMLITVWVFLGIEGASVFSSRARKQQDVGKATVIGYLITLGLLCLISLLSLGILHRDKLLLLETPSMAGILGSIIGYSGIIIVSIAVIISVGGAFLSWLLLITEVPYIAGKEEIFPKVFAFTNQHNTPGFSLFISCLLIQIFLILSYFASNTYYLIVTLSASMVIIPYSLTSLFLLKEIIIDRKKIQKEFNKKEYFLSIISIFYGIWLIYAGGIKYLLLSMILYGLGLGLFIWAKREAKNKIFKNIFEIIIAAVIIILSVIAIIIEIIQTL